MAINVPSQFRILSSKANLDERYGPYTSLTEALTFISSPNALRAKGLTFGVIESGSVVEYQWTTDDLTDSGVVIKSNLGIVEEDDPTVPSYVKSITETNITSWDNKVDKVTGKVLTTNDYTTAEKTKLASTNIYDSAAVAEVAKVASKVDKIAGKGLSTNDYSSAAVTEVEKIAGKLGATQQAVDSLKLNGRLDTTFQSKLVPDDSIYIDQSDNSIRANTRKFVTSIEWDGITNILTLPYETSDVYKVSIGGFDIDETDDWDLTSLTEIELYSSNRFGGTNLIKVEAEFIITP